MKTCAQEHVTDAELAVLQLMWNQGAVTVRQLTEKLYPQGGNSKRATVQKLVDRLMVKKYISRNRDVWPHLVEALIGREEVIGHRLESIADQLCDGALQSLLAAIVKAASLSAKDRKSLRGILDELDEKAKRKRG